MHQYGMFSPHCSNIFIFLSTIKAHHIEAYIVKSCHHILSCKEVWYFTIHVILSSVHASTNFEFLNYWMTLSGHFIRYNVWLLANQPIPWQQLKAFVHVDVVKTTFWSAKRSTECGRKVIWVTLSPCVLVLGGQVGWYWWVFHTPDLMGFSHLTFNKKKNLSWGHRIVQIRENIQWAAVVWTVVAYWHLGFSGQEGQTCWRT